MTPRAHSTNVYSRFILKDRQAFTGFILPINGNSFKATHREILVINNKK